MMRLRATVACITMISMLMGGCSNYVVHLQYPEESGNFFNDRPSTAIFVAEPQDLRPQKEREGKGVIVNMRFPSDSHMDFPMTSVVRRAMMQDILGTRVARLVQNPDNADYTLDTKLLSMTTELHRGTKQFVVPIMVGIAVGLAAGAGTDVSHGVKWGLVGMILGTFIPLPTDTEGIVEMRLELRDQRSGEMVWSTNCTGLEKDRPAISISAREDKKLAERYLPPALKRANACAVGQLYQYLSNVESPVPDGGSESDPSSPQGGDGS
jgi:hypothetical protein